MENIEHEPLKAPFPYFGGKRKVAALVWECFGRVENYVEPFFGSGAVLLGRPDEPSTETVNDADGLLSNFWRALRMEPETVAKYADWPVNENDLHARHAWLVGQKETLQARLEGDPEFYDVKIAGWWVWGMACWIGSGFCSGRGPWQVRDRQLVHVGNEGQGVNRQLVHVGNEGQGVNRQLVHVGNEGQGVNRQRVHVGDEGRGVNRKRERLSGFAETDVNAFAGIEHKRPVIAGPAGGNAPLAGNEDLIAYFQALAARLRKVRVCCGDWSRVCGPSVTKKHGLTACFLDPPYADTAARASNLYRKDCERVAHDVREWAIAEGKDKLMRIALCGYEGEHKMPADWDCIAWNAGAGFSGQRHAGAGNNGKKERIWFSPHCLGPKEPSLL
jgi:site-specific DNA-adenine methylase